MNDDKLNWQEACEFLHCSKTTLYRLVYEGKLPAYGVGKRNRYYLESDCRKLLQDSYKAMLQAIEEDDK